MKSIVFLLSLVCLSSCAIGPVVNHETARSVGSGNHELTAGYGNTEFFGKWNYGLTQNWDFGIQMEAHSVGARTKYAFINGQSGGLSLAGALGAGSSTGGDFYYGDIMISYLNGIIEPYGTVRFVKVKVDPTEFTLDDTGDLKFRIEDDDFSYGQVFAGTRIWLTPGAFLSLEASTLFKLSDVDFANRILYSAALGFKF